jgi:hemolysin III
VTVFDFHDFVSSSSHLLTAAWAVFAALIMVRLAPPGRRGVVAVYGASMVLLFTASGLFHGVRFESESEFHFYQKLDHAAIYLLIAGTNTPPMMVLLRGAWRRWFLRTVWGLALLGVVTLCLFPKPPHALNAGLYLCLGWLGAVPILHYYRAVGWRAMNWVWLGGLCYTIGVTCELAKWPVIVPGWVQSHEVFHFFDCAGNFAFFVFVVRYVIPHREVELLSSRGGAGVPTAARAPAELPRILTPLSAPK